LPVVFIVVLFAGIRKASLQHRLESQFDLLIGGHRRRCVVANVADRGNSYIAR
jgi:hypothetical protein